MLNRINTTLKIITSHLDKSWRSFRKGIANPANPLHQALSLIKPTWPAAIALVPLVILLTLLRRTYFNFSEVSKGIYIEAWGTVFDILLVGIILTIFTFARNRTERIERYLEEIDDFKKWDSEEARLRIAGDIRRLAKLGITNIDFSGIVLRNFSFHSQDIESLKGSTFSRGLRLDKISKNATELENVEFIYVDCNDTVFSRSTGKFAGLGLVGKNLCFSYANLKYASFEGAKLSWTDYQANRDDWYEDLGEDPDGRPMRNQVHNPAFAGADLKGCSFRYAEFDHADFRDAENILEADFRGAKGLETCFFDSTVRNIVLKSAEINISA